MKKVKVSMILNIISFALVLLGSILMFCGIKFMPAGSLLELSKIEMFKFFTVDSNLLLGIVSLVMAIYEYRVIKGKIESIPEAVYIFKLVSTCAVFLTFTTTLVFLVPSYGFYALYSNSNLFFHLVVPILALVSYIFFEKHDNKYLYIIYGLIPLLMYSVYYITNILIHSDTVENINKYDFYGFLYGDINNIFMVIPSVFIVGILLSALTIYLNKKYAK